MTPGVFRIGMQAARPNFDPLAWSLNTAATTGANTMASTPANRGLSAETTGNIIASGAGLATTLLGFIKPARSGTVASAPAGTDPALLALLQQQEAAAASQRTVMYVGVGVVGLLALAGLGFAAYKATR